MSIDSRENFTGIVTNAAGTIAPRGSLVEAENVVIRRPGAIQPRDGLRPADGMNGTEVWGLAHQRRDLVARFSLPDVRYFDLGGTEITYKGGLAPSPLRRDILSSAQARGNLYLPTQRGVVRLLEGSNAWDDAGLNMVNYMSLAGWTQGPLAPYIKNGLTGFTSTTYLENAAAQGPVPAAQYWIAWMFFLESVPVTQESLLSRGKGIHPAGTGYLLQLTPSTIYFSQVVSGSYYPDTSIAMPAGAAGRMHLLVYSYGGGSGRLWLDGVAGPTATHAALPTDPTDVATWGNGRLFGAMPLQSATLVSAARGTGPITQATIDTFYADTKTNGAMTFVPVMAVTHSWLFQGFPVSAPIGGQVPTLSGPTPSLTTAPTLWPGDAEVYPDEFWLPRGYHAAYRLVGVSRDANGGLIRRSAPSAAFEVSNPTSASGSAAYPSLSISTLRPEGAAYGEVEIYRTRAWPQDVTLDDEMQLVGTIPTPPGWVTPPPPATVFVDRVADGARGAVLYTSPSRGGILQQNDPPPACACIALFKGSLFFANTRGPARIVISFNRAGDVTGVAGGIGGRVYSGTSVFGSATITVSSTVGLQPGQIVNGPGFPVDPPVSVVTVGAGSVTVSASAVITAGAGNFAFEDVIWLGTSPISPQGLAAADAIYPPNITSTKVVPPLAGYEQTWVLTSDTREPAAWTPFTIRATHGNEYSPALPLYSEAPKTWDQDVWPGGIMWSKTDEPEHVTPVSYAFVGDLKKACLGLVPTRDALFILKEDGVFRLTGVNATWRIDPYDPTLFCCLPNSVYPLQEQAYFLSNKGVIAFSDGGSEIVSLPVNDAVKAVVDQVYAQFRTTGFYEVPQLAGSFAGVFERENEYTLMLGKALPALVYNRNTQAWTTFKYYATTAEPSEIVNVFNAPNAGRVVYVHKRTGVNAWSSRWTMLSTDTPIVGLAEGIDPQILPPASTARYDGAASVAVTAGASTPLVHIATITPFVPVLRDDVVTDVAGRFWRVATTNVTGPTVELVAQRNPAGGYYSVATGAGHVIRSVRCKATPQDFLTPPPRPKRWRALSTAFTRFTGPVVLRYAYSSAESPRAIDAWDEEEADTVFSLGVIDYPQGYAYAGLVPSAHARSWSMSGSIRWAMTHGVVRLEGIYVEAEAGEIGRQQKAL